MLRKFLPSFINKPLFGHRDKYSAREDNFEKDSDFLKFKDSWEEFYLNNQKSKIGLFVDNFSFKIIRELDFSGKTILEVGPGYIEHLKFNNTKPEKYIIADIYKNNLIKSEEILHNKGIENVEKVLLDRDSLEGLSVCNADIVLSFNHLEHIIDLDSYLKSMKDIIKKGGLLVGSVPTDGGLLWGSGRYFTARRYAYKVMQMDYDKIICYEHPNFVDKIEQLLDKHFLPVKKKMQPFGCLVGFDFNFAFNFVYENSK